MLPFMSGLLNLMAGVAAVALMGGVGPVAGGEEVSTRRLAGDDRYGTAAVIARETFPHGDVNVVVAHGSDFPDALSGVNPAGSQYWGAGPGPVVLTRSTDLPAVTEDVIRELTPFDGIVMGTTDVVSRQVGRQVADLVERSWRLGGRTRYETNQFSYVNTFQDEAEYPGQVDGVYTAFLASGESFADALSIGPLAYRHRLPLLLTARDRLPEATAESLRYRQGHEHQIEDLVIVGGRGAVSSQVVRDIERLGLGINVRRIAGQNRQETAVKVFEYAEQALGWTPEHVNLARGDGFADALAGAPHAAVERSPVLLTARVDELGSVTREFLRSRSGTVSSIDVFGGPGAVSDAVVADARAAATAQ